MTIVRLHFPSQRGGAYHSDTKNSFFVFIEELISDLRLSGRIRTSETYATAFNSFRRFRNHLDISLDDFDSTVVDAYEAYMKRHGISPNSTSFYMRNLRAMYNRAVDCGLTSQCHPFKHVYTGVEKTTKRAISLTKLRKIKDVDLSDNPPLEFARDMFMFSFYTRGMSFIDMAYLKKTDLNGGILTYRRKKTGQKLHIKWESCMQEIVDKYYIPDSEYLMSIINPYSRFPERKQYLYASHNVNRSLKMIGKRIKMNIPLTMYVSRHSWASIAKSKNIPLSVISEGMGHESENTTRIYLTTLDTDTIDKANSLILKLI